ncbi:MAG TPA: AI-2E family transporter [Rhodopila sp.]|uniref:AI-2E family transporter n=1 Tax=Rhodopila sp. TaxID=2480087 RepID=UPI002CC00A72|nr:AI-2E family transporter [Rhodopila sp.]HVY16824.1 AI-2E family transporter [Rhodopila sp.]
MTQEPASRAQWVARIALGLLLLAAGFWTLHRYIPALLWAAILGIAVWPLYQRAVRRWPPGQHNIVLPGVFTLIIGLIFAVPLIAVAWEVIREIHSIYAAIDQARTQGIPAPEFLSRLPAGSRVVTTWWNDNLGSPEAASALLRRARTSDLVANGRELGADVAHRVVLFGFMLLTLFFLLRDGERLVAQLRRASVRAFGPTGERVGRQIIASVHGTVDGLVLVGLGEGLILGAAYVLADVPHPALFGLLTAVAAMVPFGVAVAFGLAAVLLAVKGSVVSAGVIVALGAVVSFVADHFIRPVLIGGTTRLPFLWVLLGILGGVETWGLMGLFLGPAIMAALILLWREWCAPPDVSTPDVSTPDVSTPDLSTPDVSMPGASAPKGP